MKNKKLIERKQDLEFHTYRVYVDWDIGNGDITEGRNLDKFILVPKREFNNLVKSFLDFQFILSPVLSTIDVGLMFNIRTDRHSARGRLVEPPSGIMARFVHGSGKELNYKLSSILKSRY